MNDIKSKILELEAGQVWNYIARRGEEESTLTINRIDSDSDHRAIYHLSIDGISIYPPHGSTPVTQISHVPVTENALLASLTTLVKSNSPDTFSEEGYSAWQEAYNQGSASAFSNPLADIINTIERSIHPLH